MSLARRCSSSSETSPNIAACRGCSLSLAISHFLELLAFIIASGLRVANDPRIFGIVGAILLHCACTLDRKSGAVRANLPSDQHRKELFGIRAGNRVAPNKLEKLISRDAAAFSQFHVRQRPRVHKQVDF